MSANVALYQRQTVGVFALQADLTVSLENIQAAETRRGEMWNALSEVEQEGLAPWVEWIESRYAIESDL